MKGRDLGALPSGISVLRHMFPLTVVGGELATIV